VQGLLAFVASRPLCRVLVTTRPVGYTTTLLTSWRHYEVLPLETSDHIDHLRSMLIGISSGDTVHVEATLAFAEAEIKKSRAGEIVARSPLLLALSLSLALRRVAFGGSKSQLYEKLFDIIHDIPNVRRTRENPASAVLTRFLDILGWDVVFHSVSPTADIIKRCAEALGADLALTSLQAVAECERCSTYWQDVGVLERVQHAGEQTIAFVHKTFGEFAAARYLASLRPPELGAEIASIINYEAANEVIGFAGSLGVANSVCAELLSNSNTPAAIAWNVPRALALVMEENNPPDDNVREKVIALAAALLESPDFPTIDAVGIALLRVAAKYPGEVAPSLTLLAQHGQVRTRLAAWAGLLACGEQYYDFDRMMDAFQTIPRRGKGSLLASLGGYTVFDRTGYELMKSFVLGAMTAVLTRLEPEGAEKVLKEVFQSGELQSVGIIESAHDLLKKFDRNFSLVSFSSDQLSDWASHFDGKAYYQMNKVAFRRMFEPLASESSPAAMKDAGSSVVIGRRPVEICRR
jgi:hypothetical protein